MKKIYLFVILLLLTLLLFGCNTEAENGSNDSANEKIESNKDVEELDTSEEENVEESKLMSDEEIKEIIKNNLDEMEHSVQANFDESIMPINETTFAAGESSVKAESIVSNTKNDFENLVAQDALDKWVRIYLYSAYISYHREYLNSDDLHTRFEVVNQSDDQFEVSFINLENDSGVSYIAGTQHLFYINENDSWVIQKREYISPEEKPLHLTFDDLKEYYSQFDEDKIKFEAIEETEVNGIKYLIYKLDNQYHARNVNDSMYNYEILDLYN